MLATPAAEEVRDEVPEIVAQEDAEAEAEDDNEFSIGSVASYLIGCRAPIAIAISPTGDNGSTATVSLARRIASSGARVVLVDMTGSGRPTDMMADGRTLPGVTDLLCGAAAFGDTIHGDHVSEAHFIPQGTSDMRLAMRGADRLSLLLDALSSAYDLVLVECGAAEVAGVSRLTQSKTVEIILSMPVIVESEFVAAMTSFEEAGYDRVVLMSDGNSDNDAGFSQRAA
jgi:Mrp family chromosome partitioning ATPase